MKYRLYRMLCVLALTRFPNWTRMYGSQELANSSRRINGMLTGRLLLIRLSGRISKMLKGWPEKRQYFQTLSLSALSYRTTLNGLTTLNDYLYRISVKLIILQIWFLSPSRRGIGAIIFLKTTSPRITRWYSEIVWSQTTLDVKNLAITS
jgi:hypothetical protein